MTPRPEVGSFAEDLYAAISPLTWDDENQGWALLHLCQAIGIMFQPVQDLSRDTPDGPGWSQALDPDRAPVFALAWLAQFSGVSLTDGLTDDQHRQEIKDMDRAKRGRPETIRARARLFLTGTKFVFIDERTEGRAYHYSIVTRISETPDPVALEREMRSKRVKPAGLILDEVAQVDFIAWDEAESTWDTAPAGMTWDTIGEGI